MKTFNKLAIDLIEETIMFHRKKDGDGFYIDFDSIPYPIFREYAALCIKHRDQDLEFLNETNPVDLSVLISNHLIEESEETLFDMDEFICNTAAEYYKDEFKERLENSFISTTFEKYHSGVLYDNSSDKLEFSYERR